MNFYSYLWLREDGSPYYVGKGNGDRAFKRHGHRVKPPKDRSRILIFPMETEADAFESEKSLIELFGRKDLGTGCLRNMTDGGEGVAGYKHDEATKKLIGSASIGRGATKGKRWRWPKEAKKNFRQKLMSPQTKARIKAWMQDWV